MVLNRNLHVSGISMSNIGFFLSFLFFFLALTLIIPGDPQARTNPSGEKTSGRKTQKSISSLFHFITLCSDGTGYKPGYKIVRGNC